MNNELIYLIKGLILGISVAAPIGPIGIICINRTMNKGYLSGVISGLGIATADLIYGVIAGLGLTIISNLLLEYKLWLQAFGVISLAYFGVKILVKKAADVNGTFSEKRDLLKDYFTTFILTITNPVTILLFVAVFAGLGLANSENSKLAIFMMVSGIFVGSGIWWLFLSGLIVKLKSRISRKLLRRIDVISGLVILGFAVVLMVNLIREMILLFE
ncbi:LysE family translocator [Puteibacter caeruleilacunae]|nr:LysE family translocator [Puteibacter caeruleilacunae]